MIRPLYSRIVEARTQLAVILPLLFLSPVAYWNYESHPFQILYYNRLIGGLHGAQEARIPESTDYWASSYRKGLEWLNENSPPNSVILVGLAEHVVAIVQEQWLREDITFTLQSQFNFEKRPELETRPVYLMYVTRTTHYKRSPILKSIPHESLPAVFEVKVDGGVAMRIIRLF